MKQSEQINELATALSKAQAEIEGAIKDSTNPFFKSSYADLKSVIDAIKVPLSRYGLAVTQMTDYDDDGKEFVETMVMHSSGQWLRGRMLLKAKDNSPQAQGSALSYSRRYSLQAALCVSSLDDDGQSAQHAKPATWPRHPYLDHKKTTTIATTIQEPPPMDDFDFGKMADQPYPNYPELIPSKESQPISIPDNGPPDDKHLSTIGGKLPQEAMITEPQRKKIFATCRQLNMKDEQIRSMLMRDFKVDSTKSLTKKQASELIEDLLK